MNNLIQGQEIEAAIVAIAGDTVFIDLNSKSEGMIDRAEFADENNQISVKEGDIIKAFFIGAKNGEMQFTTKLSGNKADKSMLENAWKNGIPVEGHVEKEIKGGYEVKIGDSAVFCPYSQMGRKQKDTEESYVGKHLTFRILEYKENGRRILVSNRAILDDERAAHIEQLKTTLKEGMTVTGTVTSLRNFGAFVDVDGFQALLPVSEIARTRIDDISTVLSVGQTVTAVILKIDWQQERISLSMKSLLADPWDTVAEKYRQGAKCTGTIARITEFGLFITLEPGLDGLLHISALPQAERNSNLRKMFKPGDEISVLIQEINPETRRISLVPASTAGQDTSARQYMEQQRSQDTGETYNPFAALLKK